MSSEASPARFVEVTVGGLTIDPVNNTPIVILRQLGGEKMVPIWIGALEASAIAFELEGVKLPRPMTHDLLRATIEALSAKVERIAIVDLKENTYFANVSLRHDGELIELDARPSDAIALALRVDTPLLVAEDVFERVLSMPKPLAEVGDKGKGVKLKVDAASHDDQKPSQGPTPLVEVAAEVAEDLLEQLDHAAFGEYEM